MVNKKSSILRDFVESLNYNEELNLLKNKSIIYINESEIRQSDKFRMTTQIKLINNKDKFMQYMFNALLKFEGHGVI